MHENNVQPITLFRHVPALSAALSRSNVARAEPLYREDRYGNVPREGDSAGISHSVAENGNPFAPPGSFSGSCDGAWPVNHIYNPAEVMIRPPDACLSVSGQAIPEGDRVG